MLLPCAIKAVVGRAHGGTVNAVLNSGHLFHCLVVPGVFGKPEAAVLGVGNQHLTPAAPDEEHSQCSAAEDDHSFVWWLELLSMQLLSYITCIVRPNFKYLESVHCLFRLNWLNCIDVLPLYCLDAGQNKQFPLFLIGIFSDSALQCWHVSKYIYVVRRIATQRMWKKR